MKTKDGKYYSVVKHLGGFMVHFEGHYYYCPTIPALVTKLTHLGLAEKKS